MNCSSMYPIVGEDLLEFESNQCHECVDEDSHDLIQIIDTIDPDVEAESVLYTPLR
ncbi:unnamed protein product, partial [Didymodactylos carnosus]